MANAVSTVSKQLENVSDALVVSNTKLIYCNLSSLVISCLLYLLTFAFFFCYLKLQSTKRHLSKRLENLDWKVDEQKEISKLIADDVIQLLPLQVFQMFMILSLLKGIFLCNRLTNNVSR